MLVALRRAHMPPSTAVNIVQRPLIGLFAPVYPIAQKCRDEPVAVRVQPDARIPGHRRCDILCLFIAARWLWMRRTAWRDPVNITIAAFLILGLMLGDPVHLQVAYGYGRPLSPLILWVVLLALESRNWAV